MSYAELNNGCFKGQGVAVNLERPETEPVGMPRRAYTISCSHNVVPSSLHPERDAVLWTECFCGKPRPDLIWAAEIEHCLIRGQAVNTLLFSLRETDR